MIGIDTNLLVRLFIEDNQIQTYKALKLIKSQKNVFVSTVVFCETIWVLQSRYHFNKTQLMGAIEHILKIHELHIEHNDAIWLAFNEFQDIDADFSDCLIGTVAKLYQCDMVATFDKNAAKSKNFKLLQ